MKNKLLKTVIRFAKYFNLIKTHIVWEGDFSYRKIKDVNKEIQWQDLYGNIKTGILMFGTKDRSCVPEACHPFVDTVLTRLPKFQQYIKVFNFEFNI